ncbi:MAG: ABC transporter ATP-binding protein [Comamonas sp.]|nr:ABC transporter ATP-binding protein [Comamonas sp.]
MTLQLHWHGLPPEIAPDTALPPGLHLLLDEADSAARVLLAALAGSAPLPPGAGITCAGHAAGTAAYAAQVCAAPLPAYDPQQAVQAWLAEQPQRWPAWDAAAWQQHVDGFALAPHLGKVWWQLSTGTQRKCWLAAALASGAALTLIAEPVAGLDKASITYLERALDALADGLAEQGTLRWVLVAHHDTLAEVQWDEVVELPVAF